MIGRIILLILLAGWSADTSAMTGQAGALNFDGTNDYVLADTATILTTDFTIELWVNPAASQTATLLQDANNKYRLSLQSGGTLLAEADGLSISSSISTSVWTHVAFVRNDIDREIRLYINGVEVANRRDNSAVSGSGGALYIGAGYNGSSVTAYFNGSLDDLRIWTTARTATQIQNNRSCAPSGCAAGLDLYLPFDEGTDSGSNSGITKAPDMTGGNHGTLSGFALSGPTSNWVAAGNVSGACGTDSRASVRGQFVLIQDGRTETSSTDSTYFGTVNGEEEIRTFTIENPGGTDLTLSSVTVTGGEFEIMEDLTNYVVPANGSVTFRVRLLPTETLGPQNGTVSIVSNATCDPYGASGQYQYNVSANVTALPVTWLDFEARSRSAAVWLTWQTADERSNLGFYVQRSSDGRTWQDLFFQPGGGNRSAVHTYSYRDDRPLPGRSYYRLRQLDADGTTDFSPVRPVLRNADPVAVNIYPNPTTGKFRVTLDADEADYCITSPSGRVVECGSLTAGRQGTGFHLPDYLPGGVYQLQLITGDALYTRRIVKW